jgi:hypothetical protein
MKFITALNCMDGRTIKPILKYFQKKIIHRRFIYRYDYRTWNGWILKKQRKYL